ncbi:MAG: hypothetical protein ABIL58_24885 [Pseudomonadota bacterium]
MKQPGADSQSRDESVLLIAAFQKSRGIVAVCPLLAEDYENVRDFEADARKKSLSGLGEVINTGMVEVLERDLVFVALTGMDFDWGRKPALLLKKGEEVVGEEVRDKATGEHLARQPHVWFLNKNFAVYKDRIDFPRDIMKRICRFEIPPLPADWCASDETPLPHESIIYASPALSTDLFLKERYFVGRNETGSGTVLIGVSLRRDGSVGQS